MRGSPLDVLLLDGVIDEVLGRINSGKEADIYLVRYAGRVVAAKVYRDRQHRSFKNNADYKEGRSVRNSRTQRAIDSGSRFGKQAEEEAWGTTEARALHQLHQAGVRVPVPVMSYEGVLLMELVTDAEGEPAPRLVEVTWEPSVARALYADLRGQIVRMLCCEIVHGDLSPYNILAASGGPTIIDFPQIVSAAHNSRAEYFFLRDYQNVQQFLAGLDRSLAATSDDGRKIWSAYCRRELTPDFVPSSAPVRRDDRDRRPPTPPPRSVADGSSRPQQGPQSHGGNHPRPQGGGAPRPQGGGAPRPQSGGAPRPHGNAPRPQGATPNPPGGAPRTQGGTPPRPPGGAPYPQGNPQRPQGNPQRPQGNPQRPQGVPVQSSNPRSRPLSPATTPRPNPPSDKVFRSPDLPPRGASPGGNDPAPAAAGSHRRRPKRRF